MYYEQISRTLLLSLIVFVSPSVFADEVCWFSPDRVLRKGSPTAKLVLDLADRKPQVYSRSVIMENYDWNYVMLDAGLHANGYMGPKDLYYEAELNQYFHGYDYYYGVQRLMSVDFPIRIQARQFRGNSSPIRTPSFNPGLRLTFWQDKTIVMGKHFSYFSLAGYHYSNGQEGDSVNADGSINTLNGSFSTDYLELAYYLAGDYGLFNWYRFSTRQHIKRTWEDYQTGQYQTAELRLQTKSDRFYTNIPLSEVRVPSFLEFDLTYKYAGRDFVVKNEVDATKNIEATLQDNLQLVVKYVGSPTSWHHLKWFVRYDYGYDNYNINFQNKINRISMGLTGYSYDLF